MIVDGEKLVSDHLRSTLSERVVGKTPNQTDTAWIRVTQLDASDDPSTGIEHLIEFFLQLDCYAGKDGGQPEASSLARSARASLKDLPNYVNGVTAVRFTGMARVPDTDVDEPARERFIVEANVWIHA